MRRQIEIVVTDVATAENRRVPIGKHQLAVRAMLHAEEARYRRCIVVLDLDACFFKQSRISGAQLKYRQRKVDEYAHFDARLRFRGKSLTDDHDDVSSS